MVATDFTPAERKYKWGGYFCLSLFLNLLLVSAVSMPKQQVMAYEVSSLKVHLLARAAPSQQAVRQPPNPQAQKMAVAAPPPPQQVAHLTPSLANDDGKDASRVIHKAKYRKQFPPAYPRRAVELGQEGTVTLHAEILPSGATRRIEVVESSGYRLLDMAALSAVQKWEFEPSKSDSQAPQWMKVPVRFIIEQ